MKKRIFMFIILILLLFILSDKGGFWDQVKDTGEAAANWTKDKSLDGWEATKDATRELVDDIRD